MEIPVEFSVPNVSVHSGDISDYSINIATDFPYKIINVVASGKLTLNGIQQLNFDEKHFSL